ncbi:hypothetical protein FOMPIDRAFT_1053911 [Fomitopsis schrenkii]|uniref:Uncharacterized protein n=1 Tax=Fomitopsis schrenkii TaxID=2126942 RepID=S8F1V9_FOMSC|nr:hypothetical protein FOMPIDRAFT_1053911 [Fomitopsis schrenkii]
MPSIASYLNETLGCVLIGAFLSLILYGCTCAQTLYYYYHYGNDRLFMKALVLTVWVLDTGKAVAEMQQLQFYLVDHHAQLFGLLKLDMYVLAPD